MAQAGAEHEAFRKRLRSLAAKRKDGNTGATRLHVASVLKRKGVNRKLLADTECLRFGGVSIFSTLFGLFWNVYSCV